MENYDYGTWEMVSISEFMSWHNEKTCQDIPFAVITSIDSTTKTFDLLDVSPELAYLRNEAIRVDDYFLVPSHLIVGEKAKKIFHGFDEIWFFRNPISSLTGKPNLTSPSTNLVAVSQFAKENDCVLALGDGAGTNFVKLSPLAKTK